MSAAGIASRLGAAKTKYGWSATCPMCAQLRAITLSVHEGSNKMVFEPTCDCSAHNVREALAAEAGVDRTELLTALEARKANGGERPAKPKPGKPKPRKPTATVAEFEAEVQRLAKLDDFTYQQERKRAADSLGDVSVLFLDKTVAAARNGNSGLGLADVEPWPHAVDGIALLNEVAATIKRHVSVPTRGEEAVALWILLAHCLDAAQHAPRLAITSAAPECGKSSLLRIVGDLVPRKLIASNITPAATFRAIEKWHPTLMIDEADTFLHDNDELRGVLNSGHSRAEAFVVRTVGENHEPQRFSTWCATAIAMIGKLPATLATRSIHIELQRLTRTEHVERYHQHKASYADLARRCARWAADHIDALRDADPEMEGINRHADNWRPLFAIADLIGGDWAGPTGRAREAAATLNHVDAGQTTPIMLLEDIRIIIGTADRINSTKLAEELHLLEGRPWPEFGKARKKITPNAIARLLRPFKVFPQNMRDPFTDEVCKGYLGSVLQAVFDRYLP